MIPAAFRRTEVVTDEEISKTRRKQAMHALQDLGEELVALSSERLAVLDLPEPLDAAVREAKRLKSFGAQRRQAQYIGRLMRDIDPAPIRACIEAWASNSRAHAAWLHEVERWRERLLADAQAMTELAHAYPAADLQHMRSLVRNARDEVAAGAAPRHYRALFRALKALMPEPGPDADSGS
jgi:ribosome-associated protein